MERFCVWQEFEDGTRERVREWVETVEAAKAFYHYTNSVGARMGMIKLVIIVDAGDSVVAEWTKDEGIVFPPEWVEAALAKGIKATKGAR